MPSIACQEYVAISIESEDMGLGSHSATERSWICFSRSQHLNFFIDEMQLLTTFFSVIF